MRAAAILVLGALAAAVGATSAAAPVPVLHELDRTMVDVNFYPDGTFQVDVMNPPDWLIYTLEPLSESPSPTILQGEARDQRLAELAGTFAIWVWLLFDGTRVEAFPEFIPAPPPGPNADPAIPPLATMRIRGQTPEGATQFSWAYGLAIDPYPMSLSTRAGAGMNSWVEGAVESERFEIASLTLPSLWEIVLEYLKLGYAYILPTGLDHILFAVGVFLVSTRFVPILGQVTAFTIAQTAALGMTLFGIISLRPAIVGPMIALSIAYLAVESLLTSELKRGRVPLMFGFGLLFGMGLGGALTLPRSERAAALLSFNLGLAVAQLTVVALMFGTVGWLRHKEWYRRRAVYPISLVLAGVGVYWTVTRIMGG